MSQFHVLPGVGSFPSLILVLSFAKGETYKLIFEVPLSSHIVYFRDSVFLIGVHQHPESTCRCLNTIYSPSVFTWVTLWKVHHLGKWITCSIKLWISIPMHKMQTFPNPAALPGNVNTIKAQYITRAIVDVSLLNLTFQINWFIPLATYCYIAMY